MTKELDLADIQGNILQAYGRQGFPKARCVLLHVNKNQAARARAFLDELRWKVTTAELWPSSKTTSLAAEKITAKKPDVAINVAFTFRGLLALDVPVRTLRGLPDEFQEGMLSRAPILQDVFSDHLKIEDLWDPVWVAELQDSSCEIHILVSLNANANPEKFDSSEAALEHEYQWLVSRCGAYKGLSILKGHRGRSEYYQEMSVLPDPRKEHFGFDDGIGDPVFEGQFPDQAVLAQNVIGQGKLTKDKQWIPLATGEFLLGHPDEAQEIPGSAMPIDFSRNGTFMAYRKLHQNVHAFHGYIARMADSYAAVTGLTPDQANETLRAKIAGRWSDGIPLMKAPTYSDWQQVRDKLEAMTTQEKINLFRDFTYSADPDGSRCPFSSHLRRSNPRDMLDPTVPPSGPARKEGAATSVLNNRRRILRRGLPYGTSGPDISDQQEHGVLMLVVCSSLFRQFEFIQQQWLQYGLDFNSGNDTCPLVGNHGPSAKFVIETAPDSGQPPFICERPPQFVETRGGAYFFVPSMTSLRMIAQGVIDPT
jgi:deferrochelatase/peroxidase EfeB